VRQASPVRLRCDGGGAWRAAQTLVAAAAGAALAAWSGLHAGLAPAVAGSSAFAAAGVAAAVAWYLARPRPADLQWDGQRWSLDGAVGQVDVMIDLGAWMLLRFRPAAGAARWLSVPEAGPARHGLRAALYSRAVAGPASDASPSSQAND
jgi:hypothetical protein